MKRLIIVSLFLVMGCVATVTPEGTYIEPLPATVVVGPPVVVGAYPPGVITRVQPLPPVVVYDDRYVYHYSGMYYYYWGGTWYFGEHDRGPWYKLPPGIIPKIFTEENPADLPERDVKLNDSKGV